MQWGSIWIFNYKNQNDSFAEHRGRVRCWKYREWLRSSVQYLLHSSTGGWLLLHCVKETCPNFKYPRPLSLAGGEGPKGEVPHCFSPSVPGHKGCHHLFPRKASSITRNLQTPSSCSILIILPFVFLCSSLPNFQTVLSLSTQMSLMGFYQTSRTILVEKITHGFLLPRLAVLSREAECSYLKGRCLIEYSYRRLSPSVHFLSSLKTQKQDCFILCAEMLLLCFTFLLKGECFTSSNSVKC